MLKYKIPQIVTLTQYHHFGLYFGLSKNKKSPKILFLRAFL